MTIARKELRALFQSPIAMIFLGVVLAFTLFLFFTWSRFFARGLADVRPLFEWLPVLLILLVSAITMRSWAEERKAGTLEVLLTLPVRTGHLVVGKFLAGMALVALALLFTLPLPFTIAMLGNLDWGPVIGGYFAAFMLAGAYMALGLCVSSRTDNQVVALMLTLVLGGLLWLVGTHDFTSLFSTSTSEVLRSIGTGSRFESVERGVLDVRDIAYYASVTTFFLVLNGVFLASERLDPGSSSGRRHTAALALSSVLVAFNVLALNMWLAPVHRLRADLTEHNDFTVSPVTADLLASLDEPLRIRAFFSEKTHPLLAPMVPQIRDLLAEYELRGRGRVTVEIADPNQDEALEAELNEQYSVRPVPFGVSDRHSQSVVNAYFHIVLAYGDAFEVLDFSDLVEVRSEATGVTVKLKNFEYDITRAIKKVSQDFQTIESLLARVPEGSKVTLYLTPAAVPASFAPTAEAMKTVGEDFARRGIGRLAFTEIDPSGDTELQTQLYEKFGVQPLAADLFATQRFYMHLVVEVGDQVERILPRGEMTEADLRTALEAAIRRGVPGQLRKVLVVTEEPVQPPPNPDLPPQMQPPPKRPDYQGLEQMLGENYEVARTELREGEVPDDVDVLLLAKPGALDERQQYSLDQYLMRGGTIVALAGRYRIEPARQSLAANAEAAPVFDLLERWGVSVRDALVMGDDVASFPLPVQQRLGGMMLQRIELVPYPFFPDLRGENLNDDQPALSGINSVTMPWSSPLTVTEPLEGRTVTWLVRTGPLATVRDGGKIDPDAVSSAGPTWTPGTEAGVQTLGTLVVGRFPSAFAERANPNDPAATGPDTSGRTLDKSIADGRLVVLGSSELVSDLMLALANQTQAEEHAGNLQLLFNLVDWATEDTDLLQIRTAGAFARTLRPLDDAERTAIEIRTWAAIFLPVVVVLGLVRFRRRNVQPLPLAPVESA